MWHTGLTPPGVFRIAYFGLSDIMEYMRQIGRDVELKDGYHRTPLIWAAQKGH